MLRRAHGSAALAGVLLLSLGGCGIALGDQDPAPSAAPTQDIAASDGGVAAGNGGQGSRRLDPAVVVISVDGLNVEAIGSRVDGLVAFPRLIEQGAATLNARSAYERTDTLPNHTSILTGRPVLGENGTFVMFNDDNGSFLERTRGAYVPGIFDVAHDHGLRTAFFAQKDKFNFLLRSWDSSHGAPDVTGADDGRDKVDVGEVRFDRSEAADVQEALIGDGVRLIFWHLRAPDSAGHEHGWMSPAYRAAVREADREIAVLLAAIDAHPRIRRSTTVIVVSDHGGMPGVRSHADPYQLANYRIPFIAWGRGVSVGADLYAVNPSRRDPGEGRPDYEAPQPIRNADAAALALRLLGLPQLPGAPAAPLAVR